MIDILLVVFVSSLVLTLILGILRNKVPLPNPAPRLNSEHWLIPLLKSFGSNLLLKELHGFVPKPPTLWCDNLGATYLFVNSIMHSCTKHIKIHFHFVCDRVATKTLHVAFISSKDQLAGIFTKPLHSDCFFLLRTSFTLVFMMDLREDHKQKHQQQIDHLNNIKPRHSRSASTNTCVQISQADLK